MEELRNGFHIFANSRGRLTNLNPPPCDTTAACYKAYCCGPAIQPFGMLPRGCKRGGSMRFYTKSRKKKSSSFRRCGFKI